MRKGNPNKNVRGIAMPNTFGGLRMTRGTLVAALAAVVIAAAAVWALRRWRRREGYKGDGNKPPPAEVLEEARHYCTGGETVGGLRRKRQGWKKYDWTPIREACKAGFGGRDKAESGGGECKHGSCTVPLLRLVAPCRNKSGTRCCARSGKCWSVRTVSSRWKQVRGLNAKRGEVVFFRDAQNGESNRLTVGVGTRQDLPPDWQGRVTYMYFPGGHQVTLYMPNGASYSMAGDGKVSLPPSYRDAIAYAVEVSVPP